MNRAYRAMFVARAQGAIAAARSLASVSHGGLKGRMRELLIHDLFRPLLPADVGVGTGEIVTTADQHSKEQDIVIFDRRLLPPLVVEAATGLFPIESVLFTIEVKSVLTRGGLRSAHESALHLRQLRYHSGVFDHAGQPAAGKITPLGSSLFALRSDLTADPLAELSRYQSVRGNSLGEPSIHMLCVVGRGNWVWQDRTGWISVAPTPDLDEVAGFMSVLLNSYPAIAASRGNPRIGFYLSDLPLKVLGTLTT